jgi:uncharacterized membrane protein YkvA (DUF1232 family)
LLTICREARLSPEEMAKRMDVSNMTVRRWMGKPGATKLPKIYSEALESAVFELMKESRLDPASAIAQDVMSHSQFRSFRAAIDSLGLSKDLLETPGQKEEDRLMAALAQMGADSEKKRLVEKKWPEILSFRNKSEAWSKCIETLLAVIQSKEQILRNKLMVYGSLFYLICPFDLIADFIPAVGYLDDLAVLGIVSNFFIGEFAALRKKTV